MQVLVLGGAGYIGSHTAKRLIESGHDVLIADNLSTGHVKAIPEKATFFEGDIRDTAFLDSVFSKNKIDLVMHFAADSLVGESMTNPIKYYDNNLVGAVRLVESMAKHDIKSIVFSSTAAVYGDKTQMPILETTSTDPQSVYGETKLAMEKLFRWTDVAHGIKYVSLRYFNACGAADCGCIGEDHSPETHLIPLALQVANGKRDFLEIYGTDYPTKDGTCVRDYIHVDDLADAHILAAEYLYNGGQSDIFNLGNGTGFTVKEIIQVAREVTKSDIPAVEIARRLGDPAELVASNAKAKDKLGWNPKKDSLNVIISSAWQWHEKNPNGFEDITN